MEKNYIHIRQKDGYQTQLFQYPAAAETVLGNVLVLHGMSEHHGRYLSFIQALCQEGFDVYTYDHRGHGTSQKLSELGFISKKHGDILLVEDAIMVCQYIKENGRSPKLAVFGHSMGSLVLRNVLCQYHDIDAAVVSSTTMPSALTLYTGLFFSSLAILLRGSKKRSAFLNRLMFGRKKYTALCTRTQYDWLTRNNTMVGKYIDDAYCGFICTTSFYRDLVRLSIRASKKSNIARMEKNQPVLFLAGDKDPVGGYSKEILKLQQIHNTLGFTEASTIIYPEARHELLNELNSNEVIQDILAFFKQRLAADAEK